MTYGRREMAYRVVPREHGTWARLDRITVLPTVLCLAHQRDVWNPAVELEEAPLT